MRNKKSYILLFMVCSIFLFTAFIPKGHGYLIEEHEDSATHRVSYSGFWVETTLHVTLRIYTSGVYSFIYSATYKSGKPALGTFTTKTTWLRYDSPGYKTAGQERDGFIYIPPFFVYGVTIVAQVHFNENNFKFYYSEEVWWNGKQIVDAWLKILEDFEWY
ncbi:MAG: hypothetical protein ACFE9S_16465 [Candidatus Hermodarchaeota archaeon]